MDSKEQSRKEYIARINRVMDYIEKHIDQPIDLSVISNVANFSPFHFHRIFTLLVGETPNSFLQRIRIEKAAQYLKDDESLSISEIAHRCGFNNATSFSRSFRKYFGFTAKEFRGAEKMSYVKNGLEFYRKNGKEFPFYDSQFCGVEFKNIIIMDTKIEVREMPEMQVVYCRHTGAFNQIYKAYEKLAKWAAPRGLLSLPDVKTITVIHDDPTLTAIEHVRQSAGIVVTEDVKVDGEIGKMVVDSGKYAVGRFELSETEFQQAWDTMCLWVTESGYQPSDNNTYELYHNSATRQPGDKFIVDICIPVKPL